MAPDPVNVSAGLPVWAGLLALLAVMIVVDLRVGSARAHMTTRIAGIWSGIWIGLAVAFGGALYVAAGSAAGGAYFAG